MLDRYIGEVLYMYIAVHPTSFFQLDPPLLPGTKALKQHSHSWRSSSQVAIWSVICKREAGSTFLDS